MSTSFCRDCLADSASQAVRCTACGSPRLIRHAALETLSIAHVDCDAFYATIEKRDDPSLAAEPVIVGGGKRGVVAAACYVARTFGVKSAMPMFEALRLCPQAKVVRPNMEKYSKAGREVRQMMLALTPLVEPLSIDEAFLDLGGTERLHGMSPAKALARFAGEVEKNLRITVSIGLSCNKFLAKVASDLDKPRGFAVLDAQRSAGLPGAEVGELHLRRRQGKRCAICPRRAFTASPICNVLSETDLSAATARKAAAWRGSPAAWMHAPSARTAKPRVFPRRPTFERDLSAFRAMERILWSQTEEVSARLKTKELAGSTVTLKLKTADFRIRTRARSLESPTQLAQRIFAAARSLLERETDGTRFRLLGVGVSSIVNADEADPADLVDGRAAKAEHAVDQVRARFGDDAVVRGLGVRAAGGELTAITYGGTSTDMALAL